MLLPYDRRENCLRCAWELGVLFILMEQWVSWLAPEYMRHCKLFFVRGQLRWFPSQRHSLSLFAPHKMIEAKAFGFLDAVMVHDCPLTKQSFTLYRRIKEGEERSLLCSQTLALLLVKCWLEGLLTSRSNTVTRDRCGERAFAQANPFSCHVM